MQDWKIKLKWFVDRVAKYFKHKDTIYTKTMTLVWI